MDINIKLLDRVLRIKHSLILLPLIVDKNSVISCERFHKVLSYIKLFTMSNTEEVVRRTKSKTEIFDSLSKEDVEKYQEAFSVSSCWE